MKQHADLEHSRAEVREQLARGGRLGKGGKASQVAENDGYLSTMALEQPVPVPRRHDEVSDLGGQKPAEPPRPLDLNHLFRHFLFQ